MASSSTETLSPLLNIFFLHLDYLDFTWRFSTQLHHAKHKMAAITVIYTFLSALTCSKKATSSARIIIGLLIFHFFPYQIPNVIHLKLVFLLNSLLEFCKL
jgi:hypothetical protein